jgi:hypothetical protein
MGIMVRTNPHELRQRANEFRLISLDGDDWHLKVALLQLADEFDLEAAEIEARSKIAASASQKSANRLHASL